MPWVAEPGPVVPGTRNSNVSGERIPLTPSASERGRSSICLVVTVPPTSELSVSMVGELASTVTVSETEPALSTTFNVETLSTVTSTPVLVDFENPGAVTATL
jgi:hypothetical protein